MQFLWYKVNPEAIEPGFTVRRQAIKKLLDGRVLFIPDNNQENPSYRLKTSLKTGAILGNNKFPNIGVPKGSRTPVAAVKGRFK